MNRFVGKINYCAFKMQKIEALRIAEIANLRQNYKQGWFYYYTSMKLSY